MKCKSCSKFLADYYYLICSSEYCGKCALEMISDISPFKQKIEKKGGKKNGTSNN